MKKIAALFSGTGCGLVSVMPLAVLVVLLALVPVHTALSQQKQTITISVRTQMNFGTILLNSAVATDIVLTPSGITDRNNVVSPQGGSASAGWFDVNGSANEFVDITLIGPSTLTNTADPSDTLRFGSMLSYVGGRETTGRNVRIGGRGTTVVRVGATLSVPAGMKGGTYGGNYQIQVVYK